MSDDYDRSDVRRVLAGEVDAFAGIVQRWKGPLVTLAYRFCRDRDLAEDLAQEAFVKAFRSLKQWRGESLFSTWLFAVAANSYRSTLRRKRLPTAPLGAVADLAAGRSAHAELEEGERARLVHQAVSALPRKYRDAVTLYYFHEMDLGRTAVSLGLSEGTVKSHLHRARSILAQRLSALLSPMRDNEELRA